MTTTENTDTRAYRVEVVRSGNWWAITVPDLPGTFSQAKRLDQVEANAREAITLMTDSEEDEVKLDIHVNTDPDIAELITALHASSHATRKARDNEAKTRRQVVRALKKKDLPTRDIGALIGLSHQRVAQILAEI